MEFEQIEQMAARDEALPSTAPLCARCCWMSMRALYAEYRRGNIGKDAASAEKKQIRASYGRSCAQEKTEKQLRECWEKQIRVSEGFRAQLHKALENGENIEQLFYLACTCIAVMTDDKTMLGSAMRDRREALAGKQLKMEAGQ